MKNKRLTLAATVVITTFAFTNCNRTKPVYTVSDSAMVPDLPEQVYDYPVSSNDYLATLGRVLFYDKELSANKNISCGSCHKQEVAFSDGQRVSKGTDNIAGDRNAPSIFAKNGRLFWDGRANGIADLVFRPIRNKIEMNIDNINTLVDRIGTLDYYTYMFKHAFPNQTKIDSSMIKSAMAEFLRNFTFSNTKFAKVNRGEANFTTPEETGKNLFFGSAGCANCHHIDGANMNVPPNGGGGGNGGGYGTTDESHNIGLDLNNPDPGVGKITRNATENGAFMIPVLLNVEFTAPYMHDGRFNTLEEVVEHYNSKIQNNPNLDPLLKDFNSGAMNPKKLNLSDTEKKGLIAFLKTLSDPSILTDPKYSDPFVTRVK